MKSIPQWRKKNKNLNWFFLTIIVKFNSLILPCICIWYIWRYSQILKRHAYTLTLFILQRFCQYPFSHIHANWFFNYNRLHNATWKTSSIKVYTFSVQQNTPKHNSLIGSFCYGKDIHEEMQRLWPSNFKLSQLDQDTLSFAHQSLYHSLLSFLCFI